MMISSVNFVETSFRTPCSVRTAINYFAQRVSNIGLRVMQIVQTALKSLFPINESIRLSLMLQLNNYPAKDQNEISASSTNLDSDIALNPPTRTYTTVTSWDAVKMASTTTKTQSNTGTYNASSIFFNAANANQKLDAKTLTRTSVSKAYAMKLEHSKSKLQS